MNYRISATVLFISLSGVVSAIEKSSFTTAAAIAVREQPVLTADKKNSKPTGACHISTGTVSNCTGGMTQPSCYSVAAKVGGVADWREGQSCN